MPLICPTCQIFGPNRRMRRPPATLHGVVFDIFGESRGDGVINPASKNRRSCRVSDNRCEEPPMWLAGADEKPGSWWNDWIRWLKPWAQEQLPARRGSWAQEAQAHLTSACRLVGAQKRTCSSSQKVPESGCAERRVILRDALAESLNASPIRAGEQPR